MYFMKMMMDTFQLKLFYQMRLGITMITKMIVNMILNAILKESILALIMIQWIRSMIFLTILKKN